MLFLLDYFRQNKFDGWYKYRQSDDEDEIPSKASPKIVEAMDMVGRLHILAATKQPQIHHLISQLDFQLT